MEEKLNQISSVRREFLDLAMKESNQCEKVGTDE